MHHRVLRRSVPITAPQTSIKLHERAVQVVPIITHVRNAPRIVLQISILTEYAAERTKIIANQIRDVSNVRLLTIATRMENTTRDIAGVVTLRSPVHVHLQRRNFCVNHVLMLVTV